MFYLYDDSRPHETRRCCKLRKTSEIRSWKPLTPQMSTPGRSTSPLTSFLVLYKQCVSLSGWISPRIIEALATVRHKCDVRLQTTGDKPRSVFLAIAYKMIPLTSGFREDRAGLRLRKRGMDGKLLRNTCASFLRARTVA